MKSLRALYAGFTKAAVLFIAKEGRERREVMVWAQIEKIPLDWRSIGCLLGLMGVIAGSIGSLLTAMSWLCEGEPYFYFHLSGAMLLFLEIPLLAVGASCLDEFDDRCRSDGRSK